MVDVVVASDNVVVVGGPSSVNVSLDIGPEGRRGSQIYTDLGKPTEVYLPDVQVNDLYINLKQSDFEYLYLYKYSSFNGVLSWSKVLRLVPNTVLNNPIVRFINGQAHTIVVSSGIPVVAKGLYFPLAALFPDGTLPISIYDLNVQYSVFSDSDVSSGLRLDSIESSFDTEVFNGSGYDTMNVDFGGNYIRAFMTAKEADTVINGFRTVNFLVTVGGKDPNANYFDASLIDDATNSIYIPAHGISDGSLVVYLNNSNSNISGLTSESVYVASLVDSNKIALVDPQTSLVIDIAPKAETETHIILKLMEIE